MNGKVRTASEILRRKDGITGFVVVAMILLSLLVVGQALAQNAPAKDKDMDKPGKRTSINFEDQLVEGQAQKPELFYLLQKRQFNYKRMIRLREDFLPEMRKTSEEIQRKGSAN